MEERLNQLEALSIDLQPFTEIIETNAETGLVPLATSNVKLFLETIWSG